MFRLSRIRRSTAAMFLFMMALNFGAEGISLFVAHGQAVLPGGLLALIQPVHSTGDSCCSDEPAPASCCSEEVVATSCGCSCCGDSCPMGSACTCGDDGRSEHSTGTFFFQGPGCHPSQDIRDSSYLPLSMQLVFLPGIMINAPSEVMAARVDTLTANAITDRNPAPLDPPPRFGAA